MKRNINLGLATLLFTSSILPVVSAHAVPATASYTLVDAPRVVTIAEEAPTVFGDVRIPGVGEEDLITPPEREGRISISNATEGAAYTLNVGVATCGAVGSQTADQGVSFVPDANYGTGYFPGSGSSSLTYEADLNFISLGGTITVRSTATAGEGVCTYDVTLTAAAAPESDGA